MELSQTKRAEFGSLIFCREEIVGDMPEEAPHPARIKAATAWHLRQFLGGESRDLSAQEAAIFKAQCDKYTPEQWWDLVHAFEAAQEREGTRTTRVAAAKAWTWGQLLSRPNRTATDEATIGAQLAQLAPAEEQALMDAHNLEKRRNAQPSDGELEALLAIHAPQALGR